MGVGPLPKKCNANSVTRVKGTPIYFETCPTPIYSLLTICHRPQLPRRGKGVLFHRPRDLKRRGFSRMPPTSFSYKFTWPHARIGLDDSRYMKAASRQRRFEPYVMLHHTLRHVYAHTVHMYMCMYAYTRIYVHLYTICAYINLHMCTHTHTHTYMTVCLFVYIS